MAKKRTQEPTDADLRKWVANDAQRLVGDELVLLHEVALALAEGGPVALLSAAQELSSYTSKVTIAAMERLGLG